LLQVEPESGTGLQPVGKFFGSVIPGHPPASAAGCKPAPHSRPACVAKRLAGILL